MICIVPPPQAHASRTASTLLYYATDQATTHNALEVFNIQLIATPILRKLRLQNLKEDICWGYKIKAVRTLKHDGPKLIALYDKEREFDLTGTSVTLETNIAKKLRAKG